MAGSSGLGGLEKASIMVGTYELKVRALLEKGSE